MATPFPTDRNSKTDETLVLRVVAAGAGATWWVEGWRLVARDLPTWLGIGIIYIVLSVALSKLPLIGEAAEWLLTPVFAGGILLGCDALQRGGRLRFSHLFDGFKRPHFVPLLTVSIINLALAAAAVLVGVVVMAGSLGLSGDLRFDNFSDDPLLLLKALGLSSVLLVAVVLVLVAIIAMAYWFAPALIVLRGARPVDSMRTSIRACMRNWVPFLVYGLIGIAIMIVALLVLLALTAAIGWETIYTMIVGTASWASIGMGLGFLGIIYIALIIVVSMVVSASTYASYHDIFAADAPPDTFAKPAD
ncbi:MAG: BPSS1780 family membrane protein [Betaproteobacteria bacterium]